MFFPTGEEKDSPKKEDPKQKPNLPAKIVPLNLEEAKRKLEGYKNQIKALQAQADALVVQDKKSAEEAVEIGLHAMNFVKEAEEKRKEIIKEPYTFFQQVNAFVKPFRDLATAVEKTCKSKHSQYTYIKELESREQEKKAQDEIRKLQARLDKEAEEKGLEKVTMPPPAVNRTTPTVTRTRGGGRGSIRKVWKMTGIEDFADVPDEYKMLNEKAVNGAIRGGVRKIKGLKIEEVPESVFREV